MMLCQRKNGGFRRFFCPKPLRAFILLTCVFVIQGCQSWRYYQQVVRGHMEVASSQMPIEDYYKSASPRERHKIKVIKSALLFARQIGLAHDDQYLSIATSVIGPVVWNVYAAEAFSIDPLLHCFPWLGCVAYRGYFKKEDAQTYALALKEQGYDVALQGVAAYSTLGVFADPVFSSFLHYDDLSLLRLLFHELAHATLYLPGGAATNESFATVLEYEALKQWLKAHSQSHLFAIALDEQHLDREVANLMRKYKLRLKKLYQDETSSSDMILGKNALMQQMRVDYKSLALRNNNNPYDQWFAQDLNNAHLVPIGLYHDRSHYFEQILHECAYQIPCYLERSKALVYDERELK